MSTDGKTKICRDCHVAKPLTDYYKHRGAPRSRCKPCSNIYRKTFKINNGYVPRARTNGFVKLPVETQYAIKQDMVTMTAKEVSLKYNLNLNTLNSWKRAGRLS